MSEKRLRKGCYYTVIECSKNDVVTVKYVGTKVKMLNQHIITDVYECETNDGKIVAFELDELT